MACAGAPPRLLLLLSAKTWMPTPAFARGRLSVGMTVRGIDHEAELLAFGINR
jgi:hypothetical protein